MPITQDRMIRVITAARAWQETYETLASMTQALAIRLKAGELSQEEFLIDLYAVLNATQPHYSLIECIGVEERYYQQHYNENKRRARNIARKRAYGSSGQAKAESFATRGAELGHALPAFDPPPPAYRPPLPSAAKPAPASDLIERKVSWERRGDELFASDSPPTAIPGPETEDDGGLF